MRLGISSYTYVWAVGIAEYPTLPQPMTPEQLLRKAAELGVSVVQIGDNLPLDRLDDRAIDRVWNEALRLGIELEVGTGGIAPAMLGRYLEIAVRLQSKIVRTLPDTHQHHPSPDEVVETLSAIATQYEQAGVTLAIENHDRFPAPVLIDILGRIGSQHVGICLDTANSLSCLETPQMVAEALGPWTVNLHVKDFRYRRPPHLKGFLVEGTPAGQGQLDVPWLLSSLRRHGRDFNAILELWPPPAATIEESVAQEDAWARESVRYLRTLIAE